MYYINCNKGKCCIGDKEDETPSHPPRMCDYRTGRGLPFIGALVTMGSVIPWHNSYPMGKGLSTIVCMFVFIFLASVDGS